MLLGWVRFDSRKKEREKVGSLSHTCRRRVAESPFFLKSVL